MLIHQILQLKYPIIQGAMSHITKGTFAATVSNHGALGVIATASLNAEQANKEIMICRSLTKRPYAVNLMLKNIHTKEIVDSIIQHRPMVVITGASNPGPYMDKLKAAGILVIPVVPSVALAKRVASMGADMVIVEGTEAGGHVGESTTMTLVPQVVDAVDIPVIAAGGIADGRGVAAALTLGASGVQIGTLLMTSDECPIHQNYKSAIIDAKDNDTVVIGRSIASPIRTLRNAMTQAYLQLEKDGADKETLEHFVTGALKRAVEEGDMLRGSMMMGQIAGLIKETRPLQEILDDLMTDTIKQHERLSMIMQQLTP